jgi:hypothetical protein
MLDNSLPQLQRVAHQLNSPVISATLDASIVLVDWYQYASSPLLRHLVRSIDIVEHLR